MAMSKKSRRCVWTMQSSSDHNVLLFLVRKTRAHTFLARILSFGHIWQHGMVYGMVQYASSFASVNRNCIQRGLNYRSIAQHKARNKKTKKTEKTVTTFIIVLSVCVLVFKHFFFHSLCAAPKKRCDFFLWEKKCSSNTKNSWQLQLCYHRNFGGECVSRQFVKLSWIQSGFEFWIKNIIEIEWNKFKLNCLERFSNHSYFSSFNV